MRSKIFAFFLIIGCLTADLRAGILTFSGSDGNLSASANFSYTDVNNNPILTINLTNTSSSMVTSSNQILTGLFFNVKNVTPLLMKAGTGSSAMASAVDGGTGSTTVSKDWAYSSQLTGAPFGLTYGLSATTSGGLFQNANTLASGGSVDTGSSVLNGITTSKGLGSLSGPLANDSVMFAINLPVNTNFTLSDITSVAFQYGSALTSSDFEVLPEPSTYAGVLSVTLLVLVLFRSRRRQKEATGA
jgi:hypothetical protein